MIFEDKFKNLKSLYVCVSGGVDSALGLFLLAKHITENNLNPKITVFTAVEPQPYWARNDKNVKKIISIINDMFPNVNIENHIIYTHQAEFCLIMNHLDVVKHLLQEKLLWLRPE